MPGRKKQSTEVEAPVRAMAPHIPITSKQTIKLRSVKGAPAEMETLPNPDPTMQNQIPTAPHSSPPADVDVDELNVEGVFDATRPPRKINQEDIQNMQEALKLMELQKLAIERSLVNHQYDKGDWVDAIEATMNRVYELAPQIIPLKEDTARLLGPKQGYVSGQTGDYSGKVSAEALYIGGQLATQANKVKQALLYRDDIDQQGKEISFKHWQKIVNERAKAGLQLQLEQAHRDEIVMQLQQKNLMLNRNEIFEDMYFKKPVFQNKHQKSM